MEGVGWVLKVGSFEEAAGLEKIWLVEAWRTVACRRICRNIVGRKADAIAVCMMETGLVECM